MSLFISTLAFDSSIADDAVSARIGILVGSFISAIVGYLILKSSLKKDDDSFE
jgi:NhaA family Na+:H+ antiporter